MAIYYQNFESFNVGDIPPYGSLTGNANNATIVADNYLTTGSRAVATQANFSEVIYGAGTSYSSGTTYVAWKSSEGNGGPVVRICNGTVTFPELVSINVEADMTMSVVMANNSIHAGNTMDVSINQEKWVWLQVNTIFSAIPHVVGTVTQTVLGIDVELGVDGTSVLHTGTITTSRLVSTLETPTPTFDRIILSNNSRFDEFSFDTLQAINSYPNPGTPAARASTALVETLELVDSAAVRATTGLIELLISDKNQRVYEM